MKDKHSHVLLHPLEDAEKILGNCSRSTTYRLAHAGKLTIVKLGSRSMVTAASLRECVAGLPKLEIKRSGKKRAA